ncbi:hypothetical protein RN001_013197 [Aquatica leii]|uniref:Uncharacterized protein n=1 Tax=Aquatica leii TaxID=1421715 RepID=A0AAN7NZP3_9COLE|nr:hypothetical protein RN001_013197 [Aquatica leii]
MRADCDQVFDHLFEDAESNANKLLIEIKMPRLCGRQTNRNNVESGHPRDYYRRTIFIPFLDHFIEELESRFNHRMESAISLERLIPDKFMKRTTSAIIAADMVYENDISVNENQLQAEIFLWDRHCSRH